MTATVPSGHHPLIVGHGPHAQVCRIAGAQKPPGIVTGLQAMVLRTPWSLSGSKGHTAHFRNDVLPRLSHGCPLDSIPLGAGEGEWE